MHKPKLTHPVKVHTNHGNHTPISETVEEEGAVFSAQEGCHPITGEKEKPAEDLFPPCTTNIVSTPPTRERGGARERVLVPVLVLVLVTTHHPSPPTITTHHPSPPTMHHPPPTTHH